MSYYSADYMKQMLSDEVDLQKKLYCRGFLITNYSDLQLEEYPFYGNWISKEIKDEKDNKYLLLTHYLNKSYIYDDNGIIHFLIGHAYNPFTMEYNETSILKYLAKALRRSSNFYWKKESELTGVFCVGYLKSGELHYSTDCTGMQLVFSGICENHLFITSHSKLVGDLFGLQQDDYIRRLVNSRFYKYWGTFLPGDLSSFKELKRVVPNFEYIYDHSLISHYRYFPKHKIKEIEEEKYQDTISDIARILENSMKLIAMKWPDRAAISVTGGRDSTTTLASAASCYDQYKYFSYISNKAEEVDAYAAQRICNYLGLEHHIYHIPEEESYYPDFDKYKAILECNAGCIGHNNINDVKKRIYLDTIHDFDVEVKSWVDELSRAEAQNKYNTTKFPTKPTIGYFRCMWKVIVDPRLILESNRIFKKYIENYYTQKVFSYLPWMDLYYWEFSWSAGEGTFLTSEHKFSDEITIPYNNRRLLYTMFTIPFEKRLNSEIQIDVIRLMNKKIEEANIYVKDIAHTDLWSFIIRTYLRVFSKI